MQVAIDIRDEYYEDFEKNRVYISKLVEEYLNNKNKPKKKFLNFRGLWKNRDIDLNEIRKEAWKH